MRQLTVFARSLSIFARPVVLFSFTRLVFFGDWFMILVYIITGYNIPDIELEARHFVAYLASAHGFLIFSAYKGSKLQGIKMPSKNHQISLRNFMTRSFSPRIFFQIFTGLSSRLGLCSFSCTELQLGNRKTTVVKYCFLSSNQKF